jgi:hypothetical protein
MDHLSVLGPAVPDPDRLSGIVRWVTGDDDAEVVDAHAEVVDYAFTSIATGGLYRVCGTTGSMRWSVFVKVLQHPRHWPLIDVIPPQAAAEIKALFPWRDELDARAQALPVLPGGLRVPLVHDVVDLGDDRLAVWMEDIDADDDPWSDRAYARAAELLARLAARRAPGSPAGACALAPGLAVRKVVESRFEMLAALVGDPAVWSRPEVVAAVDDDYRADLERALALTPALLDEMDSLPQGLPHGDAAPVNLLRPRDEPGTYVAIDWAFQCQLPLGHDLGQLLCGEVERGRMNPSRLPRLLDVTLASYVDGLAAEGLDVPAETVLRGLVCSALAPRNLPGAFPIEHLDPAPDEGYLRRRAGLGRWILDLLGAA